LYSSNLIFSTIFFSTISIEIPSLPEHILVEGCDTAVAKWSIRMWFELLTFIIGIAFGFLHRGKEDFMGILRNGAIAGLVLGIIFVLIATFVVPEGMTLSASFLGVFGIFVVIILYVIIFIIGAFIGDWLEGLRK
jgi:hypothetical protein